MKKIFKNLEEQIEILKFRNMIINDEAYAKEVLLRENYFFLNGYRHLFMIDNKYKEGTTFEEVYSLFLFDRNFRNVLFKYLLIVENNLKSIISYQLSKKYGYKETEYLKPENFNTSREKVKQVNDILKKMKRQIRTNANSHSATYHYLNNYGYIPLWILVKVLSFGLVGELFCILKPEDQDAISEIYNVGVKTFEDYLPILANYRNLCAHEEIVFENRTQKQIGDTVFHSLLKLEEDEFGYLQGKDDLFALIIILRQILSDEDFNNMMLEMEKVIDNLSYNLHTITIDDVLSRMGFPKNYMDIRKINKKVDR